MPQQRLWGNQLDVRSNNTAWTWIAMLKEATWEDPILISWHSRVVPSTMATSRMARVHLDFRNELSTDDGLLLKGPSLSFCPASMRSTLKDYIMATCQQERSRRMPGSIYIVLDWMHWLHKKMPGVHLPFTPSQRATASPWCCHNSPGNAQWWTTSMWMANCTC